MSFMWILRCSFHDVHGQQEKTQVILWWVFVPLTPRVFGLTIILFWPRLVRLVGSCGWLLWWKMLLKSWCWLHSEVKLIFRQRCVRFKLLSALSSFVLLLLHPPYLMFISLILRKFHLSFLNTFRENVEYLVKVESFWIILWGGYQSIIKTQQWLFSSMWTIWSN